MKNYQNKPVEPTPPKSALESACVRDYMTDAKDLITFHPDTEIMEVVETLLGNRITGAPVLNSKGELVGLIDDKDCLKVIFDSSYHNQPMDASTVAHFMSNVMKTVSIRTDIHDLADVFLNSIYKRLLVLDEEGKLAGQISRRDVLRAIREVNKNAR